MQTNNLSGVNFGFNVEKNQFNRTKSQESFLNYCLNENEHPDLNAIDSFVMKEPYDRDGQVFIKEDDKGNTTIILKLHNYWRQEVETLESKFDLNKNNKKEIQEQFDAFLDRAVFHFYTIADYAHCTPKKIQQLIRLREDAQSQENAYIQSDWIA